MGNENSSATPTSGEADFGRKAAMALLAQATVQEMKDFWAHWANKPQVET